MRLRRRVAVPVAGPVGADAPGVHLERADDVRRAGDRSGAARSRSARSAAVRRAARRARPGPALPVNSSAAVCPDAHALEERDARRQVARGQSVLRGGQDEQLAPARRRALRRRIAVLALVGGSACWCRRARRAGRSRPRRPWLGRGRRRTAAGGRCRGRPATGSSSVSATLSRSHGSSSVVQQHVRACVTGGVLQPDADAAGEDLVGVAAAPRPSRPRSAGPIHTAGGNGVLLAGR